MLIRLNAQLLPIANDIIVGGLACSVGLASHEVVDRASAGANSLLSRGHCVRLVIARDPVTHIAHKPATRQAVLQHNRIPKPQALILSKSVWHLHMANVVKIINNYIGHSDKRRNCFRTKIIAKQN